MSDSGPDFAGYDLEPSSPELQLGVLGSCLTHVFLIQAADLGVPLDSLSVEVTGQIDPRAGKPGFESVPVYPHNIAYDVHLESPAGSAEIAALHEAVERACPTCNGRGTVISDPCSHCHGQGRVTKERNLSVNIPPGVEDGTRIRLAGEGEAGLRGGPSGDLYIFISLRPHEFFKRDGADLFCQVPISMATAWSLARRAKE